MSNILEEYLVKIGATADVGSFNRAESAIKGLTGSLEKLTFMLRAGGIIGAFAGLTKAIKDQITAVADLDMEYQKLASTMWTTKESGKALAELPKLMKAKPEDIAWIPELREQFMRLRAEMSEFSTPSDAADQLRWIREIGYEVQSLQLKFMMFREWVVYYLIKYLGPYIEKIQEFFKTLNKTLGGNMATWANKVAYAISKIVDVMAAVFRLGKNIYDVADSFFSNLPGKVKALVPLFAVVGAALMASPFGLFLTAIGGALLLLEDFFVYMDGGISSTHLAPMWAMLDRLINGDALNQYLTNVKDTLYDILDVFAEMIDGMKLPEFWRDSIKATEQLANGLLNVYNALFDIFKLTRLNKNDFLGMFKKLGELMMFPWRMMMRWVTLFGTVLSALAKAIEGKYEEAGKLLSNGASSFGSSLKNDIKSMLGANARPGKVSQGSDAGFDAFVNGLVGQESGGNPYAVNERTGAYGTFQIMPENWAGWAADAGLDPNSPMTPENQEIVARAKLRYYYDNYGPEGAAAAWYAGEINGQRWRDGAPDAIGEGGHYSWDAPQGYGNEPSVAQYVAEVMEKMGGYMPSATPDVQEKATMDGFYIAPDSYAAKPPGMNTAYIPTVGGGFGGALNDNSSTFAIQNCTIITQATDAEGIRKGMERYLGGFNRGASIGVTTV